jgi:Diadenosine tetraphosphate (Ap4A) hydrolase and other HIT family hydrolases
MNDKYLSPFLDKRNRLFENEIGFVIYDGFPVSEGHCLIIPKRVYSDYFDSTEQELKGLNELVFRTKEYLDKKYKPTWI